jgi:hypothetical protein
MVLSGTALAAPPEPAPPFEPQEFSLCGTTVLVESTVQKQRLHKNGRQTGQLRFRVTNVETGVSVDVNASGPGRGGETQEGDVLTYTFQATGLNIVFPFTPGEAKAMRAAGLPELFYSAGPIDLVGMTNLVTDEATLTVNRRPSRIVDLCEQLT